MNKPFAKRSESRYGLHHKGAATLAAKPFGRSRRPRQRCAGRPRQSSCRGRRTLGPPRSRRHPRPARSRAWVYKRPVISCDVLVVGAGPTGLTLAIELRRRGVDVLLIDALDAPQHWDRATVVHPRSLEVFEALGIAEEFLAAGVPVRAARLHSAGEVLVEVDFSRSGAPYAYNVGLSEEATEGFLTDKLLELGGSVERSTRPPAVRQGDAG